MANRKKTSHVLDEFSFVETFKGKDFTKHERRLLCALGEYGFVSSRQLADIAENFDTCLASDLTSEDVGEQPS